MSELVVIEQTSALQVFTEGERIDPILAAIREQATAFTPDLTTVKGRKEIASMANKVARSKTYLDDIGKELVAQYKLIPAKIDANRKLIRDELDKLKAEVRKPLTDWEEAEKSRVQGIKDRIEVIRQHGFMTDDSHMIASAIERVEAAAIDESFDEFTEEAEAVMDKVLAGLRHQYTLAVKKEAEAAELARLRDEQIKREQEEREARIAKEAAEKATREANEKAAREKAESEARELRAKLAQEQAEKAAAQAIADAEAKAKQAVEDERIRVEAEAAKEATAEAARLADEDNRWRVHSELLEDLESVGCGEAVARELLAAMIKGKIRNIEIIY